MRAIFVPEDETCFYLFEGSSAEAVRLVASGPGFATNGSWGLAPERVPAKCTRKPDVSLSQC